jgi:hypothetical protein
MSMNIVWSGQVITVQTEAQIHAWLALIWKAAA